MRIYLSFITNTCRESRYIKKDIKITSCPMGWFFKKNASLEVLAMQKLIILA